MKLVLATIVVVATVCAGCVSQRVDITKTAKGAYAATNANEVEILRTVPSRKFIELATVTTTGHQPGAEAKMHNALRDGTARLGANAVILTDSGINEAGLMWSRGVAVRWQ